MNMMTDTTIIIESSNFLIGNVFIFAKSCVVNNMAYPMQKGWRVEAVYCHYIIGPDRMVCNRIKCIWIPAATRRCISLAAKAIASRRP
jgi:hypothetical protein